MNVCKCIKIVPLLLLINACTSGSNPESTTIESSGDGVSSTTTSTTTSSTSSDAANGVSNMDSAVVSVGDTSDMLSAEEIIALGSSVGSVSGTTDQVGTDQSQTGIDQPVIEQPVVQPAVQPVVQPNEVASPDVTPTTDNGTDTNNGTSTPTTVNTPASPENNSIVRIPFTDRANAPKIDGDTLDYLAGTELLDGEWRSSAQLNGANEPLSISQYMFGEPGTNNNSVSHHWAAVHDGEYLYVLVVSDDAGEHFQDTNELRKPWKDDSVELFIDGNNSRLNQYDGVDDFHITFNLFSSTDVVNSSFIANPKISATETSATLPSDLIFAAGPGKGPAAIDFARGRKDIYEIRIKLSELNIQIGSPFGIELQINDDDNGGSRDAKWGWNHPAGNSSDNDFTWQNPSFMGTAILLQ